MQVTSTIRCGDPLFSLMKLEYTGWLATGGTSGKEVILREKRSRKYRIKIFRLKLCFQENRLRKCS